MLRKGDAETVSDEKATKIRKVLPCRLFLPLFLVLLCLMLGTVSTAAPMCFAECGRMVQQAELRENVSLQGLGTLLLHYTQCKLLSLSLDISSLCLGEGYKQGICSFKSLSDCQARPDFVHGLAGYCFCKYLMGLFIVTNITTLHVRCWAKSCVNAGLSQQ